MRASLLASATETSRKGFFSMSFLIQSAMGVGLSLMWRMTAVAPTTSSRRRYRSPCFEMPPNLVLPPVECRSEEHTSELQSLMRISYAVFCLKKKKQQKNNHVPASIYTK